MSNNGNGKAPPKVEMAPSSYESEQAALGAVLANNALLTEMRGFLAAKDFFFLKHEWIFEAMLALADSGSLIDAITIREELRRAGRQETSPTRTTIWARSRITWSPRTMGSSTRTSWSGPATGGASWALPKRPPN